LTVADDEAEIRRLVESYAAAADRRDSNTVAELFVEDGEFAMFLDPSTEAPTAQRRGREEIRSAIDRLGAYRATYHSIGSCTVEVVGERAHGDTRCDAHHLLEEPDALRDHTMYIRYVDELVRTTTGWRFARRELRVIWTAVSSVDLARPAS
jgi:uncharacterized protein (TIGR02246 family)